MKTIILPRRETLAAAAHSIAALLDEKPQAVLAVSAGDDCLELYDVLASQCAEGQLDLSQARLFALTEFEGLSADDARSCRARLQNRLVGPCAVPASQVRFLSENDLERYDDEIAAAVRSGSPISGRRSLTRFPDIFNFTSFGSFISGIRSLMLLLLRMSVVSSLHSPSALISKITLSLRSSSFTSVKKRTLPSRISFLPSVSQRIVQVGIAEASSSNCSSRMPVPEI